MHLVVDLSPHGFGHVAQTAPVVNALRARHAELQLTVRGDFPQRLLAERLDGPFSHLPGTPDVGMCMASAIDVLAEASHRAYRALHAGWEQAVAHQAGVLSDLAPDLLLSNVGYLSLAAATAAGVPAVALSSLNWADVYRRYCGELDGSEPVLRDMRAAYASAACFVRITPGLPMAGLGDVRTVGPVARVATLQRERVRSRLGVPDVRALVLVALGGIDTRLPFEDWPDTPDLYWLVPDDWCRARRDAAGYGAVGLPFTDMLAACDAVVTKPGYGTLLEAACNGVPVLYASRPDWPETPHMAHWLAEHARAAEIPRERLWRGDFLDELRALIRAPCPPRVAPSGIAQAAAVLDAFLAG